MDPAELGAAIARETNNQLVITSDGPPRIIHLIGHTNVDKIKDGTLPEVAAMRRRSAT